MILISLTSIFGNSKVLIKTLESLLNQTVKPDEIWLFLSETPHLLDTGFKNRHLPPFLSDYIANNPIIKLKWTENTGPYRKLLPAYEALKDTDSLIITVDDDTVYVKTLLENMLTAWNTYKCCIAYRTVSFSKPFGPTPLGQWNYLEKKVADADADPLYLYTFHTGKGGVLYHTSFFNIPEFLTGPYLQIADTNDDIWFNFWRIKQNIACFTLKSEYMIKDNITKFALYNNYNHNKNDAMMNKMYNYLFNTSL